MAGDPGCDFFASSEWDERLRRYVGRTWDLERALSRLTERDVPEVLADLAKSTGIDRNALHDHTLGELLELDGDEVVDVTLDEAVDEWRGVEESDLPDECPHDPVVDGRCVFHAPPESVDRSQVREAFLEKINSSDSDTNLFVGLTAPSLDLSHRTVDTAHERPIDLRFSEIGRLDLTGADVAQDVVATGLVARSATFEKASFHGEVDLSGCILGGDIEANGDDEDIDRVVTTDNFAEFEGDVSFRHTSFGSKTDFKRTVFGGDTSFNSASFAGIAMFNFASFDGGLDLMHAVFKRKADFSKATVGGYAVMNASYTDNAMFNYTTFEGQADFWNCTFEGMVDLWATEFDEYADFRHTSFEDFTSIKEAHFDDGCDFSGVRFHHQVNMDRVTATEPIDLSEATLPSGRIVQPARGTTYYDFSRATLGDILLDTPDSGPPPFTLFRFVETDFDGFEFARHREQLRRNWQLHEFEGDDREPDTNQLEATYLRAKNGATQTGDGKAASEFFLREMRYRRKGNWNVARYGSGVGERVRGVVWWVVNWFYNASCGYGERPLRTALASVAIVLGFTAVYWASPLQLETSGPIAYLTFSLQTLVTLIYGGIPTVDPVYVRLLAAIEAFVGAFFIALFVFALTRSIHR